MSGFDYSLGELIWDIRRKIETVTKKGRKIVGNPLNLKKQTISSESFCVEEVDLPKPNIPIIVSNLSTSKKRNEERAKPMKKAARQTLEDILDSSTISEDLQKKQHNKFSSMVSESSSSEESSIANRHVKDKRGHFKKNQTPKVISVVSEESSSSSNEYYKYRPRFRIWT
ncbi:hypothetical protein QYM36_013975 [Artemia franciscana]|uniref:Uncharacterized protein n=1 Tax=Artemia franciscana TaxID=6661 RepID=A0AA88KV39_ARTSF|nr:hypothetical protein QYM36_013975 [Artemia franciscana]